MTTVEEITAAIAKLPADDVARIAEDERAGRLKALAERGAGRTWPR